MFQRFHRMAVAGMTQGGKTYFVRNAIVPMLGKYVIYDPDMQFDALATAPHNARIVDNYMEFKRLFPLYPRIVFQPRDEMMQNYDARILEFEQICYDINSLGSANLTFVVDEIAYITLKRRVAFVPPNFQLMIARREKDPFRVGVIFTTQRPKHACLDLLTQCRHIYAFKLLNKDVKYVEESFPIQIEALINSMEEFCCVHYDVEDKRVTVEKFERDATGEGKIIILSQFDDVGTGMPGIPRE